MVWCVLVASILAALYSMELVRRANYSYARLNRTIRYSRWLKSYRQQIDMHKSIAATVVMKMDAISKDNRQWQDTCAALKKSHGKLYDENQVLSKRTMLLEARNKAIEILVNTGNVHSDDTTSNNCIHCRQLGLRVCLGDVIHGKKTDIATYTSTMFPPVTYVSMAEIAKRMSTGIGKICTNTACGHEVMCHNWYGCSIKSCKCLVSYPKQSHPFALAYQIMTEKHEWMMPVGSLYAYRKYAGGSWQKKTGSETITLGETHAFTQEERGATWVEVE